MDFRISILGGSTPFVSALFDALAAVAEELPRLRFVLHGRDREALAIVSTFAARFVNGLGWTVEATDELRVALEDPDMVLHQIRYGGLAGRNDDETLCAAFGLPCDETLGLGGLNALLRTGRAIADVGEALARHCPDAWIVNLTNPLSAVTTLLRRRYGMTRCLGVCELPLLTARAVASILDVPFAALGWHYSGINHRGFLHHLSVEGRDVLPDLIRALPDARLPGIEAAWVDDLQAVPLKYFALLMRSPAGTPGGRARFIVDLRRDLLADMAGGAAGLPVRLMDRAMPRYPLGVVPIVLALTGARTVDTVASVPNDTLVTPEVRIALDRDGIREAATVRPPEPVRRALAPLVSHEAAMVRACQAPSADTICEAVRLDPLIPANVEEDCSTRLAGQWASP